MALCEVCESVLRLRENFHIYSIHSLPHQALCLSLYEDREPILGVSGVRHNRPLPRV